MTGAEPKAFWDDRYASAGERMWSGKANPSLVRVVEELAPGRALDLGCGEGGDVLWLAQQGWDATGIDISSVAVERATAAAAELGLPADRARFVATDLSTWSGGGETYDLVTASFFQSPVELPRFEVLRRAAGLVANGGHLLVIAHADFPPWASPEDRAAHTGEGSHRFFTPEEEVTELALPSAEWDVVIAEPRDRPATAPDGTPSHLTDSVVLLRRAP